MTKTYYDIKIFFLFLVENFSYHIDLAYANNVLFAIILSLLIGFFQLPNKQYDNIIIQSLRQGRFSIELWTKGKHFVV